MENEDKWLEFVQEGLKSGRVAILTGAGISAESGIATYRDYDEKLAQNPLWDEVDPREMATPRAFRKNRNRVWRWYMNRLRGIRATEPNEAHQLINRLAKHNPNVQVFTQNVDGLHEAAGTEVQRLHGSAQEYRCLKCEHIGVIPPLSTLKHAWPYCDECGASRTRPNVVWFGEGLSDKVWTNAVHAFWKADYKLVIGTSLLVQPAASLITVGNGIVIEINPGLTEATEGVDISLRAGATAGLKYLLPDLMVSDKNI